MDERSEHYKSFYKPYVGLEVDGFYHYLKTNDEQFSLSDEGSPNVKFCSIVQSSGTGKSRLMVEVRLVYLVLIPSGSICPQLRQKYVLVLYMNLREASDIYSFPSRDPIPAHILTKVSECSQVDYTFRCCAFLA